MENQAIIIRINTLIEDQGVSASAFAKRIGFNQSNLSKVLNGTRPVPPKLINAICSNLGISYTWLTTGQGQKNSDQAAGEDEGSAGYMLVPLVNIDSVGGMHSDNAVTDEPQYTVGVIPFNGARQGDICIVESGNSMVPTIPAGSVMLLRNIPDWREYFGYGGIYVIELRDGRRVTKEARRSEVDAMNNILCHSHNETVADEELPKSMIVSVWKVVKVLTNMGF